MKKIFAIVTAFSAMFLMMTPAHAVTKQVLYEVTAFGTQFNLSPIITMGTGFHVSYTWELTTNPGTNQCEVSGDQHDLSYGYHGYWNSPPDQESGSGTFYVSSVLTKRWQFGANVIGPACYADIQYWRYV